MFAAEALAIGDIEWGTTVFAFADMVGEETLWCRDVAASTIIDGFTSVAGALQHLVTPCPMLRGEELSIGLLLYRSGGAEVERRHLKADLFRHLGTDVDEG